MGIRQQKREKPNAQTKMSDTPSVSWKGKSSKKKQKKKSVRQQKTSEMSQTNYLIRDLSQTAIAAVVALVVLGIVWYLQ